MHVRDRSVFLLIFFLLHLYCLFSVRSLLVNYCGVPCVCYVIIVIILVVALVLVAVDCLFESSLQLLAEYLQVNIQIFVLTLAHLKSFQSHLTTRCLFTIKRLV